MIRQYGLVCLVGAMLAFLVAAAIAPTVHSSFALAAQVFPK